MKLSEICIERPVFASVLSLVLIVIGYIGWSHLETRYFPKTKQPIAQVSVYYPGASPSVMEQDVTRYLENTLIDIDGLTNMTSSSTYGWSTIHLRFAPGSNLVKEMGDVRDAVSSVRNKLPLDAYPPSISSGGVARPVLNVGFIDNHLTPAKIRDYVEQTVQPVLLYLPGMGAVWLYGASSYAMRIWLNPQKMAAYGVTVTDVRNMLTSNNIDFSAGSIRGKSRNYSLVADTKLQSTKAFKNLIVKETNGQIVRLSNIAKVELGSSSLQDSPMRINGKSAIDVEIRPLDSANPITVATETKQALAKLQKQLPKGMKLVITYDQSTYLKAAINESFKSLAEAIILVMLVVFLFLGSLRAAIIPIVTIPVCVIAVFGVMLACDFSINVMTLLAIILAIGLVVDDAIVMLENIHRHIEAGQAPFMAAIKGSREIGFSVIAMTITLAAVYAPLGFAKGFTASVFREFAFTLAGAVLISGFVALTLSPMMCSRVLRQQQQESRFEHWLNHVLARLSQAYQKFLTTMLAKKWWVVLVLLIIAALGYLIYLTVPQSFIPKEDIGYFTTSIHSPPGSTIDYTNRYMLKLDKIYKKHPEILSNAAFIFSGSANNFVTMKPWDQRKRSTEQVIDQLRQQIDQLPGALVTIDMPDPVSYGSDTSGKAIVAHIMTFGSYLDLQKTMEKLKQKLMDYPGIIDVTSNLKFDNHVYNVVFKRNEAASLGVNLQDVADTISTMLAGSHITDMQRNGKSYDVLVQMQLKDLESFSGLNNIYVRSSTTDPTTGVGKMIPLSNLVKMESAVRQSTLYHTNRMRSATLSANVADGYSLSTVVSHLTKVIQSTINPSERFQYGGRIEAFLQSSGTMFGLFALSIIFIYLVLAAQFESFVDPFIILLSVPLCIVGALATLKLAGGSLNLYTNIGLITLVGLITKHGILITQFANTRLKEGENLIDAVRNAAVVRLRPILMTTLAMTLGAIPLALATGPGSVSHQQIGWVIVGGMLFGTFFSLVVVPVAYYLLARFDHKKKKILALCEST